MSSTNKVINETAGVAEGKKKKRLERKDVVVEEESNITVRLLEPSKYLVTNMTTNDEDEEVVRELAKRMEEVKAKIAKKALTNQLPELVNAYVAERELELAVINKKIADAKAGLLDEELLAKAGKKLDKPTKTKTGKVLISIKSGAPRAEAVMGKGSMRANKLKSLISADGEGVRFVSKGTKGWRYGLWKGDICAQHDETETFIMPIWSDLVKELGFEKGMTLALFKQQLSTQ